ncbi:MAG: hypothetical protein V4631_09580 [Pseudomonadota bacterium]
MPKTIPVPKAMRVATPAVPPVFRPDAPRSAMPGSGANVGAVQRKPGTPAVYRPGLAVPGLRIQRAAAAVPASTLKASAAVFTPAPVLDNLGTIRTELDTFWQASKQRWQNAANNFQYLPGGGVREQLAHLRDDHGSGHISAADFATLSAEWTGRIEAGYAFSILRSSTYRTGYHMMLLQAHASYSARGNNSIFNYHIRQS